MNSTLACSGVPVAFDREVASAFAEVRIPLFSAAYRRAGFERLELSIAGRFENYSDAGQTTSPKVGVLWQPYSELVLRANRCALEMVLIVRIRRGIRDDDGSVVTLTPHL